MSPEMAPGVSANATSSSRWHRLLGPGREEVARHGLDGGSSARSITFIVDATHDRHLARGTGTAGVAGRVPANPDQGVVVLLDDVASPASRDRIRAALAEARTGWRFSVVGDEPALGELRAILHEAGLLDEEITLELAARGHGDAPGVSRGDVLVYCGHCHSKTRATAHGAVACSGCAVELTVSYHHSRRLGAYLGYFADAEIVPAVQSQPSEDTNELVHA